MEIEERKPSAIWFQSTHTMKRKWNRGGALSRKIFPKLKLESDLEMDKCKDRSIRILVQQECIPVECVPSAAVAVCCGGVSARRGCLPRGKASACRGGVCLVCPEWCLPPGGGGSAWGLSVQGGVCPRGCLPSRGVCLFCLGVSGRHPRCGQNS